MKRIALTLCIAASCVMSPARAASTPSASSATPPSLATSCAEHYDVVIGVGDKQKLEGALGNALNLQKQFGAACVNIEIVSFSNTVTALSPMSPKATLIKEVLHAGVKLVACQNSLNKFQMTEDDLFPGITTVPSGVAELVKRQKEGYLYVQP